jgi:hypothetical protein
VRSNWSYALPFGVITVAGTVVFEGLPAFGLCLAHFNDLGSLFRTEAFFLHLEEQYQKVAASFLMYITPVPSGISLPQNEHLLGLYDISTDQPLLL